MASKLALKNRIKSINSTRKITFAMKMIANSKLTKIKSSLLSNNVYMKNLDEICLDVINNLDEINHPLLSNKVSKEKVCFMFVSDMGLCKDYNLAIFKHLSSNVDKDTKLIVVGTKYIKNIEKAGYRIVNEQLTSEDVEYVTLVNLLEPYILDLKQDKISSISILYTKFINNLSFKPDLINILPKFNLSNASSSNLDLIPNENDVIDYMLNLYLKNKLYNCYLQSKNCEHLSRRMAMENATDNADELKEKLQLEYNQARQSAITQEITEIVAGANAL